jgi:hypothetical protein
MPEYDMSSEKRPPTLLPEGHRVVRVTEMILGTSKKGNEMYTVTIEDVATHKSMQVWMVTEKGKRWMLKSLLTAVGVPAGQDGVYKFEIPEVLGKTATAVIEHVKEPWVNREGETVDSIKAKVTEFYVAEKEPPTVWEEEETSKS